MKVWLLYGGRFKELRPKEAGFSEAQYVLCQHTEDLWLRAGVVGNKLFSPGDKYYAELMNELIAGNAELVPIEDALKRMEREHRAQLEEE